MPQSSSAEHANKSDTLSLAAFVKRRTGVPMGHSRSLPNMLRRSFGAVSIADFWRYWNPIWAYSLGRWVHRPLSQMLPTYLAVWLTFVVSGALHDVAVSLVYWGFNTWLTVWFACMGLLVVGSEAIKLRFSALKWPLRIPLHCTWVAATYWLARSADTALHQWFSVSWPH